MHGDSTLAGSDSIPRPEAGEHAPAPAPAQDTPAPLFGDDATLAGPAGGPKPRTAAQVPEKVGRYIVTDVLGRGGMGIVYKAYDPELDRKVAVKLMLPGRGVDDEERLAREARAMAKLSHPNVVPVHDVGRQGDQLFVAMEYVEGRTLGTWLEEAERSWREIVGMFRAAGEGLCAAHDAGVTHRDFKPDNVLVDRRGKPQVTDFGLALGREEAELRTLPDDANMSSEASRLTREGSFVGTPAYMAPEQFLGEAIDARTDQFSFCVALWEALYGQRPFEGEFLPELVLSVTEGKLLAPPRGRRVPGWLFHVLRRGLATRPDERWPSMPALVDALGRDPGRRRRSAALGGVGVVGVALAAYGLVLERDARCSAAGDDIGRLWNDKRDSVAQAFEAAAADVGPATFDRIDTLLADYARSLAEQRMGACVAARVDGTESASVQGLRDGCVDEYANRLSTLIDVFGQADRGTVENAVISASKLPSATSCANLKLLHQNATPPPPPEIAEAVAEGQHMLSKATSLRDAGKFEDASGIVEGVFQSEAAGAYPTLRTRALVLRGSLQHHLGKLEESASTLREAYFSALREGEDPIAADSATLLVNTLEDAAKFDEALGWAEHASAEIDRLDEHRLARADLDVYVSRVHTARAEYEVSRELLQSAVKSFEAELGADHLRIALVLNDLAHIQFSLGEVADAQAGLTRALEIQQRALGDHPLTAATIHNLGNIATAAHRPTDAKAYFEKALSMRKALLPAGHKDISSTTANLATILSDLGEQVQARTLIERTLQTQVEVYGKQHPAVGGLYNTLGTIEARQGNWSEARDAFEHARSIHSEVFGDDHPAVGEVLHNLGTTCLNLGQLDEAKAALQQALRVYEKHHGAEHLGTATILATLGRVELGLGNASRAVEVLKRSIGLKQRAGVPPSELAPARFALAKALDASGETAAARETAVASLHEFEAFASVSPALAGPGDAGAQEVRRWLETRTAHAVE